MLGMVEHPGGGAAFDHGPAAQHERFVRQLAYDRQVVADQDAPAAGAYPASPRPTAAREANSWP